MDQNEKDSLPKPLKTIITASTFVCAGSFLGLKAIVNKDFLPWLPADSVPYFGYPLLIVFLISLFFGAKGLVEIIKSFNRIRTTYMKVVEDLKKKQENDGNN